MPVVLYQFSKTKKILLENSDFICHKTTMLSIQFVYSLHLKPLGPTEEKLKKGQKAKMFP